MKKLPHRGVESPLEHVLAETVDHRRRRENEGTQSSLSNVLWRCCVDPTWIVREHSTPKEHTLRVYISNDSVLAPYVEAAP
jgi:hypothetical protein